MSMPVIEGDWKRKGGLFLLCVCNYMFSLVVSLAHV